ncbi:MAG: McrC family protein [Patescibacteria group bacterium]|nr:McrC family protein [Patescibacteria group bacterium]MEA3499988.1 McrC family protein [Candidatus Neomarinimicrobiota bacterium]
MNKNNFILIEHSFIFTGEKTKEPKQDGKNIKVPQKVFDEIKTFVLRNSKKEDNDIVNFLIPAYKKGYGEILKAKNYVGVIQTKNGITIEILPKIYGVSDDSKDGKEIFLKMLKTLKKSPFKVSNFANLDLLKMPLLDVFINMFLDELDTLIKQGLRKAYIPKSENLFTLKGKLNFNKNIRHNLVHKERFFVEYDEFSADRAENRLIKSTLLFLNQKARSNSTQQRIRKFIFIFDEISESKNIDKDLSKCKSNRLMTHYDTILVWCRIFLKKQTFTNYKGNDIAFAILFPMERIFEDYVAAWLRKNIDVKSIQLQTQKVIGYLLTNNKYKMIPDIVFNNGKIIADTKWKTLNNNNKISQNDLYQMYAYATKPYADDNSKEKTKRIILIYPQTENFNEKIDYKFSDDIGLIIYPFNISESFANNYYENSNLSKLLFVNSWQIKTGTKNENKTFTNRNHISINFRL